MYDTELIEQLKQNDDAAFEAVSKMFLKSLTAFTTRQITSEIAAEELVHKVFEELWKTIIKKKVDFKDINGLRTFLYIKTADRITDYRRHQRAVQNHRTYYQALSAGHYDIQYAIDATDIVDRMLNDLKASHPEVVKMLLLIKEGHTQARAAEILNIPISTFKTKLKRFVQDAREKYKGDFEFMILLLLLSYSPN